MATFTGTGAAETITPDSVSPTVIVNPPGVRPGGGADAINAGGGNDIVAGGGGNDVVGLGDGDDRFFWLPGHGADAVDGGTGDDTFEFNGVTGTDTIEVFRTGAVAKVSDVGPAVTLTGIETIKVFALGGEDAVFVRDLGGTGVEGVVVDLGLTAGAPGDGLMDEVYVQGTSAADTLIVTASGGVVRVDGMAADLSIVGIDGATDTVRLVGGLGDDRLDASAMSRKAMSVGIEGDEGNDTLIGGKGNDWHLGEDGDDVIRGGNGKDSLDGGAGVDLLKGGKGKDTFEFSTELIGSGRDRIKDFKLGVDTIAIETGPGALGDKLDKDEFRIGVKAKDGDDFILYDDDSGVLRWDADGKGGNDAVAFARIGKHLDLTHKDFDVLLG